MESSSIVSRGGDRGGREGKDEDRDEKKRGKASEVEDKDQSIKRKKRKGVMKRRHLPHHLFALEGMSDAMEDFLAGRISFSYFEDVSQDPFWEDYRENDRRDFEGLHFPPNPSSYDSDPRFPPHDSKDC
eukprot:TRINITY_DN2369_c0_g2_i1.p1 TRINITY_DN2369_c0_g2~~TRINITY_DN2369_c0_g2_i1.p1  ORF type:complete len:129 (+),score=35.65 TRINITY_DN2369_c0_g2_i1:524-910(+)